MKKTLIALTLGLSVLTGYSQGQLNFNTFVPAGTAPYGAPIFGLNPANPGRIATGQGTGSQSNPTGATDYTGHPALSGSGFTAQLWGGLDAASLAAPAAGTGQRGFSTVSALAGHLSSGVTAQYSHAAGTILTLQVRAWDNRGGTITSWAMVMADPTIPHGMSSTFQSPGLTVAPTPPPTTPGMTSFNLFAVPEPSVLALGALGLGALILRRIRR
jgi:hypothetical protein